MGLLESVLGSVLNGGQSSQQAPMGQAGGGLGGGLGGIVGALAANPQLLQLLMGLLMGGRSAQAGGATPSGGSPLDGLLEQFQGAGLGDVLGSWIGTGQNRAISPEQIGQVFGQDRLSSLGQQIGMGGQDLASELSQILPGLIDQMTPQGELPRPGQGGGNEGLFGMLEAFGQRR